MDKLDEYVEVISGLNVVTCVLPKNFNRAVLAQLCSLLAQDSSDRPRAVCRRIGKRNGVMILRAVNETACHSAWHGDFNELVDVAIEGGAVALEFV